MGLLINPIDALTLINFLSSYHRDCQCRPPPPPILTQLFNECVGGGPNFRWLRTRTSVEFPPGIQIVVDTDGIFFCQ